MTMKKLQAINIACIRQHTKIFSHVCFELHANEVLFIHGENGSGKSSLLRVIAGLAMPSHGEIFWQGQLIQPIAAEYWRELHYVGHTNGIKLGLSVMENLQLTSSLSQIRLPNEKVTECLEQLQLTSQQHTLVRYLSAGQKRRLALAKLFLFPKVLWILDEPLTALDEKAQYFFLAELALHLKNGGISIISTHQKINLLTSATIKKMRLNKC